MSTSTTEGYYRWRDVVWNWAPALNPIHRRAVSSVVHPKALLDLSHPLMLPGKDAVEMYIAQCPDESKVLCFSLKQVQYLQYYIHDMGLCDPSLPPNQAVIQPGDVIPPEDEYVPLPGAVMLPSFFTHVEPVYFYTSKAMSKLDRQLRQDAKAIRRAVDLPMPAVDPYAALNTQLQDHATKIIEHVATNATEEYFQHAQNAYLYAAAGGIAATDAEVLDLAAGRSLFVSLAVRIHPVQKNRLLDVGYAALCFTQDPNAPPDAELDEFREAGNWIVQQEIGFPYVPSTFQYGTSLPFSRDVIGAEVRRKLGDLRKRAGAGPTYIIIHSNDADIGDFELLSLDIEQWDARFVGDDSDVPSYASSRATNKTFTIDTSRLFAAVEADQPGDMSTVQGYTTRTLTDVLTVCFPGKTAHLNSDNAGNTAAYVMEVFLLLIGQEDFGKPLSATRADFSDLLVMPEEGEEEEEEEFSEPEPLVYTGAEVVEEDDYDSDFDGIAGVVYVDDHGVETLYESGEGRR